VSGPVAVPSSPIDLGTQVNFSVVVGGGVRPYSYSWQSLPAGCSSSDSAYLICVPTAAGVSSVAVSVTDAVGGQVTSGSLSFHVNAALVLGSVSSSPTVTDLGGTVTFTALGVSGGGGAYAYAWSGLPPGCTPIDSASVSCQPSGTGSFAPAMTLTDPDGGNVTASTHVTILPDPTVGSIGVSLRITDVNQTVAYFAEHVSGGVGGYSYAWTGLPTGCTSANSSILTCTPIAAGNFSVKLTVTDAARFSGAVTLEYLIRPLPTVTVPTASAASIVVGQTFDLTVNATPGSGNLSYTWSGLPPGCASVNSSTLVCDPTTNGTFLVVVTVKDSNGGSSISTGLSLVVEPRPASSASIDEYLWIGGAVALVVAVVAAVVVARRRRKSPPPSSPS